MGATNAGSEIVDRRCRDAALSDLSGETRPAAYLSASSTDQDIPDMWTHLQSDVVTPVELFFLRSDQLQSERYI